MLTRLLVIEHNGMSQRKCQKSSEVGRTKAETLNPLVHLLTTCAAARHWLSHGSMRQLAWMLARPPLHWESSLLRATMENIEPADLIKISLYSGWLYLTNYGKFYVCFAIRENINNKKCANFTVV